MRLLDFYIAKAIVNATLLVLCVLGAVEILFGFIAELSQIGIANYGFFHALIYVFLHIPSNLYQLFPMAGFLGSLIGLGRLASSSELIVMRSVGISMIKIIGVVIETAIIMIIIMGFIGEYCAPKLLLIADTYKNAALKHSTGLRSLGGVWLRDKSAFIHINRIISQNEIKDISRFEFNAQHQLQISAYAPLGKYINGRWVLFNVRQSVFDYSRVQQHIVPQQPINIIFNPLELLQGNKAVYQQSILELAHTIKFKRAAGLNTTNFVFTYWQRLIMPVTIIVMICLGVPFIFGSLRTSSMGFRVLMGVVIGFIFYMLNQFFGPFAIVYNFPPVYAAIMPTVIFGIVCVTLLSFSKR